MVDIKKLSQVLKGTQFFDYLEEVKAIISDVRKPVNVKPEIEVDVRKAVCEIIDDLFVQRLKKINEDNKEADDWN